MRRTLSVWAAARAQAGARVRGSGAPAAFAQLHDRLASSLVRRLGEPPLGLTCPTPVQAQVLAELPALARAGGSDRPEARDVLACAPPGSGRSLSILLPALQRRLNSVGLIRRGLGSSQVRAATGLPASAPKDQIADQYRKSAMGALIICPSHGVAMRLRQQAVALAGPALGVHVLSDVLPRHVQERSLLQHPLDLILATLGMLNCHLAVRPELARAAVYAETVVLTAPEDMLRLGQGQEVEELLARLPGKEERLNMIFYQEESELIQRLAAHVLNPRYHTIEPPRRDSTPPVRPNVQRAIMAHSPGETFSLLASLVAQDIQAQERSKVVVLCPTDTLAKAVAQMLAAMNLGSKVVYKASTGRFGPRTKALNAFKSARQGVLVTKEINEHSVNGLADTTRIVHFGSPDHSEKYTASLSYLNGGGVADTLLAPFEAASVDFILPPDRGVEIVPSETVWDTHASLGLKTQDELSASASRMLKAMEQEQVQNLYNDLYLYHTSLASLLRLDPKDSQAAVQSWFAQFAPPLLPPTPTFKPKRANQPERYGRTPVRDGSQPRFSTELVESPSGYKGLDGFRSGFGSAVPR